MLQIGDIHFPDYRNEFLADLKDATVSPRLVESAVPNRLRNAMRKAVSLCSTESISALLFCGDLTSKGQLGPYQECVEYVVENFGIGEPGRWNQSAIKRRARKP